MFLLPCPEHCWTFGEPATNIIFIQNLFKCQPNPDTSVLDKTFIAFDTENRKTVDRKLKNPREVYFDFFKDFFVRIPVKIT
jgi:hypothetical protein